MGRIIKEKLLMDNWIANREFTTAKSFNMLEDSKITNTMEKGESSRTIIFCRDSSLMVWFPKENLSGNKMANLTFTQGSLMKKWKFMEKVTFIEF